MSVAFAAPPVAEVVLAVGFAPVAALGSAEIVQLWLDRFRGSLPKIQEQPPFQMAVESLTGPVGAASNFSLQMVPTYPQPRFWMLDETETMLIQVQRDWFARNWRRMKPNDAYPRFPEMKEAFERDLRTLLSYLEERDLGTISPTQIELTYINHVYTGTGEAMPLSQLLSVIAGRDIPGLPGPESERYAATYLIRHQEETVGRLHVSAEPAFRKTDLAPIAQLTITARGKPLAASAESALAFLDVAADWTLRAFAGLTTPAMHEIWGRQ